MFLEDESGESSAQEEEGSEEGETDDHDDDEFNFNDQQLERRNANTSGRNELAPQNMQWAIRNRDTSRNTVRMPAGSNLIFIDPMVLRRSTVPTNTSVATSPQEHYTMATTASNLARGFGIIVRQISELLSNLSYNAFNDLELSLKIKSEEAGELQVCLNEIEFIYLYKALHKSKIVFLGLCRKTFKAYLELDVFCNGQYRGTIKIWNILDKLY